MVALPVLLEDLVRRACTDDGSVTVVAPAATSVTAFVQTPALHDVDVIITAAGVRDDSSDARALLECVPTARLLLIEQVAGTGVLVELRPTRSVLGPVSPPELLRAVTDDRAHRAAWQTMDDRSWQGRD